MTEPDPPPFVVSFTASIALVTALGEALASLPPDSLQYSRAGSALAMALNVVVLLLPPDVARAAQRHTWATCELPPHQNTVAALDDVNLQLYASAFLGYIDRLVSETP
jgi:hypothetical protein